MRIWSGCVRAYGITIAAAALVSCPCCEYGRKAWQTEVTYAAAVGGGGAAADAVDDERRRTGPDAKPTRIYYGCTQSGHVTHRR